MKWLWKILISLFDRKKPEPVDPWADRSEPADPPMTNELEGKPEIVEYICTLSDGTQVRFNDYMVGDFWGGVPSAGWGEFRTPDGKLIARDVNTLIRHHDGVGIAVTKLSHGKRYYWRTDNGKKVDVYEDGWMPHVERKTDSALKELGYAPITECKTKILRWQI